MSVAPRRGELVKLTNAPTWLMFLLQGNGCSQSCSACYFHGVKGDRCWCTVSKANGFFCGVCEDFFDGT